MRRRTLRGRVSAVGVAVIGGWVLLLAVALNVVLAARLDAEAAAVLRDRAAAALSTLTVRPDGSVRVAERAGDAALDSGVSVYSGTRPVERATGSADLAAAAAGLVGRGTLFADAPGRRLLARPVQRGGRQVATVVVSIATAPYERTRHTAEIASGILALLVVGVSYPVLRSAVRRALVPVDAMTRQAGEWSAYGLDQRFGATERYEELRRLATTLDGVLDRLSAVVRREQRLSAELSHELRTPLSAIIAEASLLQRAQEDATSPSPEVDHGARAITAAAAVMSRTIETLLVAARADVVETPGVCRVRDVVDDVVTQLLSQRAAIGRPSPAIEHEIAEDLSVGVEARVVERIIAPVLDNACRYATEQISITARRDGGVVRIAVRDDGPGIAEDRAEDVFDPGRARVHDTHDGAGLGLPLARRLARASAGDVAVHPDPTGPGALLIVTLPPV